MNTNITLLGQSALLTVSNLEIHTYVISYMWITGVFKFCHTSLRPWHDWLLKRECCVVGWLRPVSVLSTSIFVPDPTIILWLCHSHGAWHAAPLPNGRERASRCGALVSCLPCQSTFVNGDVPMSNVRNELVNRRTWWQLVTEHRTAMGTQKPEEWANLLITRFEEQVHLSCDSNYESV